MQVYRLAFQLCKPYDLPMTQAAVLTGDLIGSTEAGPEAVDRAMETMAYTAEHLEKSFGVNSLRFTRFRGDGWQVMVIPAQKYLRVATGILAYLRRADNGLHTRIGIGVGHIITPGTVNLSDANGMAFIHSGDALDTISGSDRIAIIGLADNELLWHRSGIETLNYLAGRWSAEQANALTWRLSTANFALHKIAENLKISRQALSSRLAVAGEKPIMAAIRAAEATL
jgi:SatD family (SatD)